jgi:hypothetical protein
MRPLSVLAVGHLPVPLYACACLARRPPSFPHLNPRFWYKFNLPNAQAARGTRARTLLVARPGPGDGTATTARRPRLAPPIGRGDAAKPLHINIILELHVENAGFFFGWSV